MFACCRFAHYLKCIVRDKVGMFAERADMEKWLNRWIGNPPGSEDYIDVDVRGVGVVVFLIFTLLEVTL